MVLKYNRLRKYCTFCTEHIEYDGETRKCKTIYNFKEIYKKLNSHKVSLNYNNELNAWKPISTNKETPSFHVQGILLDSPNVGTYSRHALGVGGFDEDAKTCYIVFDDKTLLPVITNQPKNIEEMVDLISVEPRLITQMPADMNSRDRQTITNACIASITEILKQNTPLNDEEADEHFLFSQLCLSAIDEYLVNCQKHDKNHSDEELDK